MSDTEPAGKPHTAIILSGGGARAAYQVGALRAIAHILVRNARMPFPPAGIQLTIADVQLRSAGNLAMMQLMARSYPAPKNAVRLSA